MRSVRAYGGSVRFVEVHPHVLRALKISRMVDYISVRTVHAHAIADIDTHAEALWQRVVEITTSDLAMDVSDCGQGFALDNAQTAPSAPEHSYAERGRGIQLMRILVDEVSITKRVCHRGTRVHLVKLLKV